MAKKFRLPPAKKTIQNLRQKDNVFSILGKRYDSDQENAVARQNLKDRYAKVQKVRGDAESRGKVVSLKAARDKALKGVPLPKEKKPVKPLSNEDDMKAAGQALRMAHHAGKISDPKIKKMVDKLRSALSSHVDNFDYDKVNEGFISRSKYYLKKITGKQRKELEDKTSKALDKHVPKDDGKRHQQLNRRWVDASIPALPDTAYTKDYLTGKGKKHTGEYSPKPSSIKKPMHGEK